MATFSQFLGLKLNAASDPFQLSDFITNWGILDASPGVFVCTSVSRPNWGSNQSGRLIFMTDIKQLSYFDGAAWNDLRDSAPVFSAGIAPNTAMSPGSSPSFSICSFTTPRPCALTVLLTFNIAVNTSDSNGGGPQGMSFAPTIDGSQISGAYLTHHTVLLWDNTVMTFGVVPSISAGTHQIGMAVFMDSGYRNTIYLRGATALGMISLYNASNTL